MDQLGRSFGAQALLRGLLLIAVSALIWIGIGFAGYAIYVAWLASVEPAWAAAITAACLLVAPLACLTVLVFRHPRPLAQASVMRPQEPEVDKAALAMLANVAKEKPLLAVLFAGVLGAAETLRRRRD